MRYEVDRVITVHCAAATSAYRLMPRLSAGYRRRIIGRSQSARAHSRMAERHCCEGAQSPCVYSQYAAVLCATLSIPAESQADDQDPWHQTVARTARTHMGPSLGSLLPHLHRDWNQTVAQQGRAVGTDRCGWLRFPRRVGLHGAELVGYLCVL
jgi:hypothetical protein